MPVQALEVVAKLVIVLVKWYTGSTTSASHCGKQGRKLHQLVTAANRGEK